MDFSKGQSSKSLNTGQDSLHQHTQQIPKYQWRKNIMGPKDTRGRGSQHGYPLSQNNDSEDEEDDEGVKRTHPSSIQESNMREKWKTSDHPPDHAPDHHNASSEVLEDENTEYTGLVDTDAKLYILEGAIGERCLFKMPSSLPLPADNNTGTYNLAVVDVSGSMAGVAGRVCAGWRDIVARALRGRTDVFLFSESVQKKQDGILLDAKDFHGGGTNLTAALQTLVAAVDGCAEQNVNVILLTDGEHTQGSTSPRDFMRTVRPSQNGKVLTVHCLGLGRNFPVQISLEIHAKLHTGSANFPPLYWAKEAKDISDEFHKMATRISDSNSKVRLSERGSTLPDEATSSSFSLGEWVHFNCPAEKLQDITMTTRGYKLHAHLEIHKLGLESVVDMIRQCNSVIINKHHRGEQIPVRLLTLLNNIFEHYHKTTVDTPATSIAHRLEKRKAKSMQFEFREEQNKLKKILTTAKFQNQLELAENVLKTTLGGGKHEARLLQIRGHSDKDFSADMEEFLGVVGDNKEQILSLNSSPEDCCRVTMCSTVLDLQDHDFNTLAELGKFDFLKTFTMSGIPVLSPVTNSANFNPWSYRIRRMLTSPYTILSTVAMESFDGEFGAKNKDIKLNDSDNNTHFNAIVPVFSPEAARVMAPIVRTRLYALCATFAILKNPHTINFNIHLAALAVAWVRVLFDHPHLPRPTYIQDTEKNIFATAEIYFSRKTVANYCRYLKESTNQALMTESEMKCDGKTLKCESLIKPMFFVKMMQIKGEISSLEVEKIMELIILEYIGRCLSRYKNDDVNATPYSDFFFESTASNKSWDEDWLQQLIKPDPDGGLSKYYTHREATMAFSKISKETVDQALGHHIGQSNIKLNSEKITSLYNTTNAGDLSWFTLKVFAREVGVAPDRIESMFSEAALTVCTVHALRYRKSRVRLAKPILNHKLTQDLIMQQIKQEKKEINVKDFETNLIKYMENMWLKAYSETHTECVRPMTRQEIIVRASQLGVKVTEKTFYEMYDYRSDVGLLTNACQTQLCPHFLKPHKSYNQHASVERLQKSFPHGLHLTASQCRDQDVASAVAHVKSGCYRRHDGEGRPLPEVTTSLEEDVGNLLAIYKEFI